MNAPVPKPVPALAPGFAEPVLDAQAVFRASMQAFAWPGTVVPCPTELKPPAPLSPVSAALALTLADFEVTLWLDATFAATPEVVNGKPYESWFFKVQPGDAIEAELAALLGMDAYDEHVDSSAH